MKSKYDNCDVDLVLKDKGNGDTNDYPITANPFRH